MSEGKQDDGGEVKVTPEMIEAGRIFLWQSDFPPQEREVPCFMTSLFQAMELARQERWLEVERLLREAP